MAKTEKTTDKTAVKSQQLVTDRFARARDYRITSQDEIWKRSYNNWRGILDTSLYPWRSKLFIPWSFTVVETIIPRIFARDPKWRAISQSPDFPADGPRTVNDLLAYQWDRLGMRLKMYDYIKDSLMYSKAFAKVGWNFKTKTKTFMEPVVGKDDEITFKKTTRSDIEHDDPCVDIIDPADIYIDPDATGLDNAAYVIHRKTVTLKELKDNPNYSNVNQIKQASYADQYMDKLMRYRDEVPPKDKHKDLVEILEYWGADDRLIVVANRGVVLRDTPNPYNHKQIPFVELDDYRDPHRLYGQSELSVIDPLQREINSIRNQRRDYDNLALNPVIRMVPGTLRNPNSAVMAPGSVWMVSDLNSMDVFQLPQLQGTARDIEQQTAQDIKMTTAIDEIGIGLLPDNPQRRSATEVVTSQQSAGRRFAMKIALLEEAVKKIGQLVFALNQQFLDQERMIQIIGERGATEWVKLGPEDVRGDYYVDIETGSMLPKDEIAQRKEAIELLQYITPIITPVVGTSPQIILPIVRMVLDTFELPGKQEIVDELKDVLGGAAKSVAEQQQANTANTQAQALSAVQSAAQPQPNVTPPQTGEEARAQALLDAAASAGR
jgi:hypothetical protein